MPRHAPGAAAVAAPKSLDAAKRAIAVNLYDEKQHSVKEICEVMGVSKPTLYKYIQAARTENDLNLALSLAHQLRGCRSRKSGTSALDLRSCLSGCNAAIRLKATQSGL